MRLISATAPSLLLIALAGAQPPIPQLQAVFPAGAQRGTTVAVTAFGNQLQTAFAIWVSGEGVKGEVLKAENNRVQLRLTVAPDAPLGERDLRLVTKGGVSNRVRFFVGAIPELNEAEPNNTVAQAQAITNLPVVINGTLNPGEDVDCFRLTLKAGETVTVDMMAQRLFPYLPAGGGQPGYLDGVLVMRDGTGRELAFCDDVFHRPDPALAFTAPADGDYVLEVHDLSYRGSIQFVYRLTIGAFPVVTHYLPLGWQAGVKVRVALSGLLINGRVFCDVPVPAAPAQPVTVLPILDGQPLAPLSLVSVPFPTTWEIEPNDRPEQAMPINPPIGINGTIYRNGDTDCFAFAAKKGQRFVLETWAWRLNSPVDTVLEIMNPQGNVLAANDDHPDGLKRPDSYLEWTAPSDGDFIVRVRNRLGEGGDGFAYFLIVRPFQPDFEVRVTEDNPRVPQGGTVAIPVSIVRREGFSGEVTVTVSEVPSGWQVRPLVLPAHRNDGALTITVPEGVALGAVPLRFIGKAQIGDTVVTRDAVGLETVQYVDQQRQDVVKAIVLGIVEPLPLRLVTPEGVEGRIGDSVALVVRVERRGEFKGAVQVNVPNLPPNAKADTITIGEGQTEGTIRVHLAPNTPPGVYTLLVQGQAKVGDQNVAVTAPAVRLTVHPAQ